MKKEANLFDCSLIDWEEVDRLYGEIKSGVKPENSQAQVTILDLPVVGLHIEECDTCREVFVEILVKHGISEGDIFKRRDGVDG